MLTGVYPNATPDKRYNIKETSELLGIHRNTLREKTQAGDIKPTIIPGKKRDRTMYEGKDINNYWLRKP